MRAMPSGHFDFTLHATKIKTSVDEFSQFSINFLFHLYVQIWGTKESNISIIFIFILFYPLIICIMDVFIDIEFYSITKKKRSNFKTFKPSSYFYSPKSFHLICKRVARKVIAGNFFLQPRQPCNNRNSWTMFVREIEVYIITSMYFIFVQVSPARFLVR